MDQDKDFTIETIINMNWDKRNSKLLIRIYELNDNYAPMDWNLIQSMFIANFYNL